MVVVLLWLRLLSNRVVWSFRLSLPILLRPSRNKTIATLPSLIPRRLNIHLDFTVGNVDYDWPLVPTSQNCLYINHNLHIPMGIDLLLKILSCNHCCRCGWYIVDVTNAVLSCLYVLLLLGCCFRTIGYIVATFGNTLPLPSHSLSLNSLPPRTIF